jgi:uncharacterized membrane protein
MSIGDAVLLAISAIIVFVIPGYIWSFLFFPNSKSISESNDDKDSLDSVGRIALSIGLSLALVSLTVFLVNAVIRFPINVYSALGNVALISIIGVILLAKFSPEALARFWRRVNIAWGSITGRG